MGWLENVQPKQVRHSMQTGCRFQCFSSRPKCLWPVSGRGPASGQVGSAAVIRWL